MNVRDYGLLEAFKTNRGQIKGGTKFNKFRFKVGDHGSDLIAVGYRIFKLWFFYHEYSTSSSSTRLYMDVKFGTEDDT